MPKLLFFSRVAFICNLCFLFTFVMHYLPSVSNGVVPSTIIVLGNVVSIVINVFMNLLYLLLLVMKKPIARFVPIWLLVVNFLFFIVQIILLVK